jgi:hypothetical protein
VRCSALFRSSHSAAPTVYHGNFIAHVRVCFQFYLAGRILNRMVSQGHLPMMSSSINALSSALSFFLWPCHSQTMPTYLQEDHPTECAFLCHAGRWFDRAYRTWTFDFVAHVKHLDAPTKDVLRQYLHFWAGWHGHDLPTNACVHRWTAGTTRGGSAAAEGRRESALTASLPRPLSFY